MTLVILVGVLALAFPQFVFSYSPMKGNLELPKELIQDDQVNNLIKKNDYKGIADYTIEAWKGQNEQTDDNLVIGFQVNPN